MGKDREESSRNTGRRTGKAAAAGILCKDWEGSSSMTIGKRTAAAGILCKDREGSSSSSRNTGQGHGRTAAGTLGKDIEGQQQ